MLKIRFLLQCYKFTKVDKRARRLQEGIILVSKSWEQKRKLLIYFLHSFSCRKLSKIMGELKRSADKIITWKKNKKTIERYLVFLQQANHSRVYLFNKLPTKIKSIIYVDLNFALKSCHIFDLTLLTLFL